MKIDKITGQAIQQVGQVKAPDATAIDKIKEAGPLMPVAPVKPEGETSIVSEIGAAARTISGEDLVNNRVTLGKPISEAIDIIAEKREAL